MSPAITADEKKWRAQDDARTLAQAEEIKNDQARLKAAATEAKKMADETMRQANAMKKIANKEPAKKQVAKKKTVTKKAVVRKPVNGKIPTKRTVANRNKRTSKK